jgi:hypothetical protein
VWEKTVNEAAMIIVFEKAEHINRRQPILFPQSGAFVAATHVKAKA